jgi:hypothetical protein
MTDANDNREPNRLWNDLDSESDLRTGADDSPDILQGVEEDEPELQSASLHETPFRAPRAGERLTQEQLEADID